MPFKNVPFHILFRRYKTRCTFVLCQFLYLSHLHLLLSSILYFFHLFTLSLSPYYPLLLLLLSITFSLKCNILFPLCFERNWRRNSRLKNRRKNNSRMKNLQLKLRRHNSNIRYKPNASYNKRNKNIIVSREPSRR